MVLKQRLRLLTYNNRVITMPDAGGDLMLTGGVGQVGNSNMLSNNTITEINLIQQ